MYFGEPFLIQVKLSHTWKYTRKLVVRLATAAMDGAKVLNVSLLVLNEDGLRALSPTNSTQFSQLLPDLNGDDYLLVRVEMPTCVEE